MIVGILQARMGSCRLPGKVMMPILGKPMLMLQIERIKRATLIDNLIVATTDKELDNQIEDLCKLLKVSCFRGSENDLLDRYYKAAKKFNADFIVRLTGDDPLTDPELINNMIIKMKNGKFDVVTNSIYPSFPEGLDLSILSFQALEKSWCKANLQSQREHVTPYIFDNSNEFSIFHFKQDADRSNLRWTVDYEKDLTLIKKIYELLYPINKKFSTEDIYNLLEKDPSLKSINSDFIRNEGLIKSIENDQKV